MHQDEDPGHQGGRYAGPRCGVPQQALGDLEVSA